MANRAHKACPNCGTANDRDAVFCGACGRPYADRDQSASAASSEQGQKPAAASPLAGRTVFGQPSPLAVSTAGAKGPKRRGGMSGPTLVDLQPPPDMLEPDAPEGAVPPKEAPPHLRPQGSSSLTGPTLLDGPSLSVEEMQRGGPAAAGELSGPAAAPSPGAAGGARTILGVPSPLVAPPGDGSQGGTAEPAPPESTSAPPSPAATPVASSPLNAGGGSAPAPAGAAGGGRLAGGRTVMGVPAMAANVPLVPPEPAVPSSEAVAGEGPEGAPAGGGPGGRPLPDAGLTMLGVPSPVGPVSGGVAEPEAVPAEAVDPTPSGDEGAVPPFQRLRWALVAVVVAAILLAVGGLFAWRAFSPSEPSSLPAQVEFGGDQVRITLRLSPEQEGAVVLAGQRQPIVQGQASFELPASAFEVGGNRLPVTLVDGAGQEQTSAVAFEVSYRAVADVSGLSSVPAHYVVNFQVASGGTLKVAGESVELDQDGSYAHRVLLADAVAGSVEEGEAAVHRVPFSVQLRGRPAINASVDTEIPRTRLELTAPLPDTVVRGGAVTCAGLVDEGAQLTINGETVAVEQGRFSHSVTLAEEGDHQVRVQAVMAGKAPRTLQVAVRRASDLRPLTAQYGAVIDANLDYAALSQGDEGLLGRRVRFHGRVVAVQQQRGRTLLQLLVDQGCAAASRCPLHVVYTGDTEIRLRSFATVYGTVRGQWRGQTQGGAPLTMPSVQARFVIPDA